MKKVFEFKKYRTFDQTIDATFKVFKLFIKPVLLHFWKHHKILTVAYFVVTFLYNYYASFNFDPEVIINNTPVKNENSLNSSLITLAFFILSFVFYIKFSLTVFGFIKSYIIHKGEFVEEEITALVSNKFWTFVGASFFLGFLLFLLTIGAIFAYAFMAVLGNVIGIFVGMFFLLIYFIYLLLLVNIYYYLITEDVDVVKAFSMSMGYIKYRFWYSIVSMGVIVLVVMLISVLLNYPLIIWLYGKFILAVESQQYDPNAKGNVLLSAYLTLSAMGDIVLRVLSILGSIVIFYSIHEARTSEGMLEKIDLIGKETSETKETPGNSENNEIKKEH